MVLFSDNGSNIASDLSDCSSLSDMFYIEEIYLDYDTSNSKESNDMHVENRFYSNNNTSNQTMPTKYMTEEN